jgi:hypothetical protein
MFTAQHHYCMLMSHLLLLVWYTTTCLMLTTYVDALSLLQNVCSFKWAHLSRSESHGIYSVHGATTSNGNNTDANLVLLANFVFEDRILESLCVMALLPMMMLIWNGGNSWEQVED